VEVSHRRETVRFFAAEGTTPAKPEHTVGTGEDAPTIARAVLERAGLDHPERSEDIGVVEALIAPVILGVIAGVLWAFVYGASTTIEAGEEINLNQGGRRGRGWKKLIYFVAEMLGTRGTIILGVVLLVLFVGWAIRLIVKRPQRLAWGPATA